MRGPNYPMSADRPTSVHNLALRADESSQMVNGLARAFLRKCSPPSELGAHVVGAKT
jgi:hypothetical protein